MNFFALGLKRFDVSMEVVVVAAIVGLLPSQTAQNRIIDGSAQFCFHKGTRDGFVSKIPKR